MWAKTRGKLTVPGSGQRGQGNPTEELDICLFSRAHNDFQGVPGVVEPSRNKRDTHSNLTMTGV